MGVILLDDKLVGHEEMISHCYTYLLYFFSFDPGEITVSALPPCDVVFSKKKLLYNMSKVFVRRLTKRSCVWAEKEVASYIAHKKGYFVDFCEKFGEDEMIRKLREGD